jgi:hypothetical protein
MRFLAVDVRPRRYGFALFERPSRLLDSGVVRFQTADQSAVRIESLITGFHPNFLVLRKLARRSKRDTTGRKLVMKAVSQEARRRGIRTSFIGERKLEITFQKKGAVTKYGIATYLALMFPDLGWKMPRRRKAWEAEQARMVMFDAVALGVGFLVSQNDDSAALELANR